MTVILILAVLIVGVGAVLYIHHRLVWGGEEYGYDKSTAAPDSGEECCGLHITCEKDSLLASVSESIEYYEDEELDRYAGRSADGYSAVEIEEFRDVLLTMQPADIAGWARSLQLRGILLPADVRDELLMIVGEARRSQTVLS